MYRLNNTIAAVSSPTSDNRVIVRITGPDTIEICGQIFSRPIAEERCGLLSDSVVLDDELEISAQLYLFPGPHSYTGDDVAEIHAHTNPAVTEALIGNLLERGLRMAGPGEFTAKAFLNGKIDLAQAEAVNEIIVSSNDYQLAAAERLLEGRLGETAAKLRDSLMDLLCLVEAGLDFSEEDIEFIARDEVVKRLVTIKDQLQNLLSGSITCESLIDLPAVGIAGAPNAGKSSLLNRLLGKDRSIVSAEHKTTRDVLTGVCTLAHCRCVLFDCAGLLVAPENILDELAQQAAIEALRNSMVVIFCADVSKAEWSEDAAIRKLIEPKALVPVATKCDLLSEHVLPDRLAELNGLFAAEFLPVSAQTGAAIELLRNTIDSKLTEKFEIPRASVVALTARHRRAVTEAIGHVSESIDELRTGNDERPCERDEKRLGDPAAVAMMLRAAHQAVSDIEKPAAAQIDEQILEQIFSRFCIGK